MPSHPKRCLSCFADSLSYAFVHTRNDTNATTCSQCQHLSCLIIRNSQLWVEPMHRSGNGIVLEVKVMMSHKDSRHHHLHRNPMVVKVISQVMACVLQILILPFLELLHM